MDRANAPDESLGYAAATASRQASMLPSRVQAKATLESVLGHEDGPVLLTGEAGVGKTWLHRQTRASFPDSYRWLEVDMSASVDPVEFQRLILQGLGYEANAGLAEGRGLIADLLIDASASAERWVLVPEEAHNTTPAVLEEVRILGNRLGKHDGFAGIMLVGQNPLIRHLTARTNAPIASRLAGRVHLRALTVDEFGEWVRDLEPDRSISDADIEQLHRMLAGNPRRYLVETRQARKPRTAIEREDRPGLFDAARKVAINDPSPAAPSRSWDVPPVIPAKPPLEVADEMIEVGWDASSELSTLPEDRNVRFDEAHTENRLPPGTAAAESEERINDHYAALQAWSEWARNQGREPVTSTIVAETIDVADHDLEDDETFIDEESAWTPVAAPAETRSESPQPFAPFSQLFSKLKEPRESIG